MRIFRESESNNKIQLILSRFVSAHVEMSLPFKKFIVYIFLVVLCNTVSHAFTKPIALEDSSSQFGWHKDNYSIYFAPTHNISLSNIIDLDKKGFFKVMPFDPRLQSFDQDMWATFQVQNTSSTRNNWLIELYDFHIDSYDIYVLNDQDFVCYHFFGGDNVKNIKKYIDHKNFIHEAIFKKNILYTFYIRIQSKQSIAINGVIRSYPNLVKYSNQEYALLSIFYGILLIMLLYCIILFFVTIESTYLYFSINIFSVALYCLSNDGLGFQYFWSDYLQFNEYVQSLSITLFTASSLLYSESFLQVKATSKKHYLIVQVLTWTRLAMFVFGILFYEPLLYMYEYDIAILIFIWFSSVYFYKREYEPARFFVLAYTALFIGFSLNILMVLGFTNTTLVTVYGFNFGIIAQLFLFSFALADRVRIVNNQTRNAQLNLINQLQENEALKDKLTTELEEKVKERTKELEFKNQQLDAFVYKASHDIKGPLKSIMGLAKLGLVDIKDEHAHEYFKHIEKSTLRLDILLQDLLQVSKIKNVVIESRLIDFNKIIQEVKDGFENIDSFSDFYIDVQIKQDRDFYSDEKMIYSIFQNLIENAFNYRDHKKRRSSLYIRIEVDKQKSLIEFADNGLGIDKGLKDKVFDMFFRASEISGGTGLGLYLVKMAVNKIGGRIQVETEITKGTTFTIVI